MKVPSMTQPRNMILLMNSVMMIPIFFALCKSLRQTFRTGEQRKKMLLLGAALLVELAGICLTTYIWENSSTSLYDILHIVGGVICLSGAWLPELVKKLLKTAAEKNAEYKHSKNGNKAHDVVPVMVTFMSFCKIIFSFSFSFFLLSYSVFRTDAADVTNHFRIGLHGWQGKGLYYFISNCCSGLLGYVASFIACTTCTKEGSYVLPLFLATPLAGVLLAVKTPCNWISIGEMSNNTCDSYKTPDIFLFSTAVACFALANLISFGFRIIENQTIVKQKESQV